MCWNAAQVREIDGGTVKNKLSHYSWRWECSENITGGLNSGNNIKEVREESASHSACYSAREDDVLNGVEVTTEGACGVFARLVIGKSVICKIVTGKKFKMQSQFFNILRVVDVL